MSTAPSSLSSVPLERGATVIADLHLDVASDDTREIEFERWLAKIGRVPRLVILGDLFDAWIGPAQSELASARRVLDAFAKLTSTGTKLDVLKGNRDFLLDADFERRTGARVLPGGLVGTMGDERVLFIHGDELCTLDRAYQRLKRVIRSRPMTWTAAHLPRSVALRVAKRLRRASTQAVASKPPYEKAQQESEVRRLAELHGCRTVVCGHAHVFRDVALEGGPRWIVLGAFGEPSSVLRVAPNGALAVDPKP